MDQRFGWSDGLTTTAAATKVDGECRTVVFCSLPHVSTLQVLAHVVLYRHESSIALLREVAGTAVRAAQRLSPATWGFELVDGQSELAGFFLPV